MDTETYTPDPIPADAAPYLRVLFKLPLGTAREYHVPPRLRPFCIGYMATKGRALKFTTGHATKKCYVSISPLEAE